VQTFGKAKLLRKYGYPNIPSGWSLVTTVTNQTYLSAATTALTYFKIEADAEGAWYNTGAAPRINATGLDYEYQPTPIADTTVDTYTYDELRAGILTITHASGATVAMTLPTGAQMDGSSDSGSMAINDSFDWTLINLSAAAADTATVTASTGHTIVGVNVVQSAHATTGGLYGNAARFRTRKTAANTFVTYRID
jgi:hypothetical protein